MVMVYIFHTGKPPFVSLVPRFEAGRFQNHGKQGLLKRLKFKRAFQFVKELGRSSVVSSTGKYPMQSLEVAVSSDA